jgi:two-component system osmolarity sensor histidine kinase EnvZ
VIEVWDRGAGIAAAAWPIALEPFQRLDVARGGQGHCGLGLAIADRIARLHGGALRRLEGGGGFGVALTGRSLPSPDPTQPAQAHAD